MQSGYPRHTTNAVTWLISAMVAVFVIQFVFIRWFNLGSSLENALALSASGFQSGKVWTVLTYGFLHSTTNLLHIVANLLGLYFLGRVLEPILGSRRFLWLFASAMASGAALWLATHWQMDGSIAMGASAGVIGLFVVFAAFFPNRPITFLLFFILPVTIKPKFAAMALLAVELVGFVFYEVMRAASPFGSGVAYSAHLGGMLAGWVYFRYIHEANWPLRKSGVDIELPRWLRKRPTAPLPPPVQIDLTRREDLRAEVDRILDKINSDGFGALTSDEKRLLDDARDLLSRR
jgi:membrane associated rhomboid family serine protease